MTRLTWGSATDIGMVRESNQDSLLVASPLFAVADGMGGHQGGEVASATALEILGASFEGATTVDDLMEAVRRANAKVWDKAQLDEDLRGMGTTLTAIAKVKFGEGDEETFAIVNVGDSRTYQLRDDEFSQLTTDHSFVEEMIRAGEISPEEAETHPKRNIVTRALGVEPTVDADVITVDPRPGDRLLLCSDGLTREVGDDQIAAVLRRLRSPDEAAHELVAMAKANGGHDNITIVIVDVEEGKDAIVPAPAAEKKDDKKKDRARGRHVKQPRTLTFRMVLFILALILLIGAVPASVVWYARSVFYVGVEGQSLVIYRGRPQPVMFFKPTITERTNVTVNDVLPSAIPPLQQGVTRSSLKDAHHYIENLTSQADAAAQAAAPAPPPTTQVPTTTRGTRNAR